jgi:hypothetical protein
MVSCTLAQLQLGLKAAKQHGGRHVLVRSGEFFVYDEAKNRVGVIDLDGSFRVHGPDAKA